MTDKTRGFTLIELLLALTVSSVLLVAWVSAVVMVWTQSNQQQRMAEQAQLGYQLGLWLARDLDRASQRGLFHWQLDAGCLLYGEEGVRLRNGVLQWRPQERECQQAGWIALHDPHGFRIDDFYIELNAQQRGVLSLAISYLDQQWFWQYQLQGPIYSL